MGLNRQREETKMLIQVTEIKPGDILLCYKDAKIDPVGSAIQSITSSEYTHAAICIDTTTAVESLVQQGVVTTEITSLIGRYDHVAVFRQPDAWGPGNVEALRLFAKSAIEAKAKYNFKGVVAFRKRHEIHTLSVSDKLRKYFEGTLSHDPVEKGSYFCSELVADCFVATGFIDPSAAIVYKSDTTSPGELGRDPTFGTFYGYASAIPGYAVPSSDEFYNTTTFNEIFGEDA